MITLFEGYLMLAFNDICTHQIFTLSAANIAASAKLHFSWFIGQQIGYYYCYIDRLYKTHDEKFC